MTLDLSEALNLVSSYLLFNFRMLVGGGRKLEWRGTCRQKSLPAVVYPFFLLVVQLACTLAYNSIIVCVLL